MSAILTVLHSLASVLSSTHVQQLSQVIYGMLATTGRITMLEISRWTEAGGSYRTIQRLYHSPLPWVQILWCFFTKLLWKSGEDYIVAGDEVVFGKAGHMTYGLGRFFSSVQKRVIPGLSFFAFSLVHVQDRQAYPLQATQVVKVTSATQNKAEMPSAPANKRSVGRPKGSKTKTGVAPLLSPELLRIQAMLQAFLRLVAGVLSVQYLAMDGHFGNYPSTWMVVQTGLHLISKLRSDAALYEPFTGQYRGRAHPKYGPRVIVRQMDAKYLKSDTVKDGLRTQIYQATLLNKEFACPLNVVVILKTNLTTHLQAHVILFTTEVKLAAEKIVDFYSLRFQIEFNFREAKQYWGLDDFMNVKEVAVTNAAHLAFFMVNFSTVLMRPFRATNPEFSVLDLKAHYRGCRYVSEIIKCLPQKPDGILLDKILEHMTQLGMIHPVLEPVSTA